MCFYDGRIYRIEGFYVPASTKANAVKLGKWLALPQVFITSKCVTEGKAKLLLTEDPHAMKG